MNGKRLHHLLAALQDWEAQYMDGRQELDLHEIYLLWLRLFRLSRRMIADHTTLMRRGTLADGAIAYTGETKRLAEFEA